MKNPALLVPNAMAVLQALATVATGSSIPAKTLGLVHMRASQINGCSVCLDMEVGKGADTPQRLCAVAVWRDAPFFTEAERAALALTEAITRLDDRADPVPDAIWAEATRHFDEPALAALVLNIALINMWNRLNVATRQIAGAQRW